jgi:hypothetical protein
MRSSRKALVFFDFLLLATIAIALSREREEAISSSRSFIAATDVGGEGDLPCKLLICIESYPTGRSFEFEILYRLPDAGGEERSFLHKQV